MEKKTKTADYYYYYEALEEMEAYDTTAQDFMDYLTKNNLDFRKAQKNEDC